MAISSPFVLCRAVGTASTLSKNLWPGATLSATLPAAGAAADVQASATTRGGVFQVKPGYNGALLNFAGVGAADETAVVEIGGFMADGTLVEVLASVSLKSITTSGTTTANINPFTGAAVSSTTYRLFDLVSITSRSNIGQVLTQVGGTEDNTPAVLFLDTRQFVYYYVIVTTIGALTEVMVAVTPVEGPQVNIANVSGSLTITGALPAGNNNIGDVDVASIAAGTNNIGVVSPGPSVNAQDDLTICQSSNSTTTGTTFAALVPTSTQPSASSSRTVITWAGRDTLFLLPFGKDTNNQTFRLRVTGWQQKNSVWYPTALCDSTWTMSSSLTGVAAQTPDNTNYFCDQGQIDDGVGILTHTSTTSDTGLVGLEVPVGLFDLVEVQFIRNGSAASANALYATY